MCSSVISDAQCFHMKVNDSSSFQKIILILSKNINLYEKLLKSESVI